jgi:hypothetical protein
MRTWRPGLLGAGLVVVGLALIAVGSASAPFAGYGPGGMLGWGPAPTVPAGTSVRLAGSRFDPPTLTMAAGASLSWFNDDALAHTITAANGSWESGNLAPGGSFERRFDSPGRTRTSAAITRA